MEPHSAFPSKGLPDEVDAKNRILHGPKYSKPREFCLKVHQRHAGTLASTVGPFCGSMPVWGPSGKVETQGLAETRLHSCSGSIGGLQGRLTTETDFLIMRNSVT